MKQIFKISIGFFLILPYNLLLAQHSFPDTINAKFIDQKISFDGKLNEPLWQSAFKISNFTQRELSFGAPATEKTETAIVYDKLAVYIGIWCYQQDADRIQAKYMQRDFSYDEDDNFKIVLSPFNDKRNGYLFIINPNGARADLLVSGNEEANMDWNGVWDAKTTITSEGWFAEIMIPFNSLQFKRENINSWAINFERNIRYKNEQVFWQGWTRDCSIYCLVNAGIVKGLENIGYARHFELKPFVLAGFEKRRNKSATFPNKVGGDLNVNLTPMLKLNITANTDFAQVEADRIAVNLSRFSLYYPEKREFFLEGYQNYQFGLGNDNQVFYTRKIGIDNFQSVPVIAGARLFGKVGPNNVGLLNIQTANKENIPSTNNTVIRYKRDIGSQSYIGGILTSKNNKNISNQVAGLDAAYSTSHFLKNKNLVILGLVSESFDKSVNLNNNFAWRFFIDYPNDLIDNFVGISSVQQNYNPELGFLNRRNFDNLTWNCRINPRWFQKWGIRQMILKPWEFSLYQTHSTGKLESFYNESRPLGFYTKSGERFEYNLQQIFERLDDTFALTDNIKFATGKYWMFRQELQVGTFHGRKFWAELVYRWGKFYTGKIYAIESSAGINVNKHLNFKTDYVHNKIKTGLANLTTNELAEYINYAFNPKIDIAFFIQWNSFDDLLFGNLRLHWLPKPGSDMYVVVNRQYDNLGRFMFSEPQNTSGAIKFVGRFTF